MSESTGWRGKVSSAVVTVLAVAIVGRLAWIWLSPLIPLALGVAIVLVLAAWWRRRNFF